MKRILSIRNYVTVLALTLVFTFSQQMKAEEIQTTQLFKEIFITAGYTTLLGGLMGTAAMFMSSKHPKKNMRWIGIGASVGFFSGTALGTYLSFGPLFVVEKATSIPALINIAQNDLSVRVPFISTGYLPTEDPSSSSTKNRFYHANIIQGTF